MLQGGLFKGFNRSLSKLVKYQRKVPKGNASATVRSVSMEAIQRSVKFTSLHTLMSELLSLSAMADPWPSLVLGCNFLPWNIYKRKSAMDFIGGALKSTRLL